MKARVKWQITKEIEYKIYFKTIKSTVDGYKWWENKEKNW